MTDQISHEDLRAALRGGPPDGYRPLDLSSVVRRGRRRRVVRRSALGVATAIALVVSVSLASNLLGGSGSSATVPAHGGRPTASLSPGDRHAALVTWADCLRDADIPGVTVVGPPPASDTISYRDDAGQALAKDYRLTNGEWGSATEYCAAKVPALFTELETQWGDLHSVPARQAADIGDYQKCLADHSLTEPRSNADEVRAEAAGCVQSVYDPDAEQVLQCPDGMQQGGLHGIYQRGPWVDSPGAAGQIFLERMSDRRTFARVEVVPANDLKDRLQVRSVDGRITGLVYLLISNKGWRLQGANVCQ